MIVMGSFIAVARMHATGRVRPELIQDGLAVLEPQGFQKTIPRILVGIVQVLNAIMQKKKFDQHSGSNSDPPCEPENVDHNLNRNVDQISVVEYQGLGFHQH
jgi:hypothetical protein